MTHAPPLDDRLLAAARATTGFLDDAEGVALAGLARTAAASGLGPLLEIGAYRGRSTLYLAAGIAAAEVPPSGRPVLFSLDHHRGSEEMQAGWEHHDERLVDERTGRMDSLGAWRRTIEDAGAEQLVVGLIGTSSIIAANWSTTLSLVFVDGGHGEDIALADYANWSPLVAPGGLLIFHDVFADPNEGGSAPYSCYLAALSSGSFVEREEARVASLRVLEATGT